MLHVFRQVPTLMALCMMALAVRPSTQCALGQEAKGVPDPEQLTLETKDGLLLKATYYGGMRQQDSVPVIILHDYKGNRNEYHALALQLQARGHAVLVPDLRGHGESKLVRAPQSTKEVEIDAASMRPDDIDRMYLVGGDLETLKAFLVQKNNQRELNIDKLCVIGSGMGAVIALNWSALDWSWPRLSTGKQGQDVKALVLVSPEWSVKGVTINRAISQPQVRTEIDMLIMVGNEKASAAREAKRLHKTLERYHGEPDENAQNNDLFYLEVKTSLQGTKLLTSRSLKLDAAIAQFIEWRLVNQDFPWAERKRFIE